MKAAKKALLLRTTAGPSASSSSSRLLTAAAPQAHPLRQQILAGERLPAPPAPRRRRRQDHPIVRVRPRTEASGSLSSSPWISTTTASAAKFFSSSSSSPPTTASPSSSSARTKEPSLIPPSTWSIASLDLSGDRGSEGGSSPTVSDAEFERLARLALLDLSLLPREKLRRDLSNMVRLIGQVQQQEQERRGNDEKEEGDGTEAGKSREDWEDEVATAEAARRMYDAPRGVRSVPFRRGSGDGNGSSAATGDDSAAGDTVEGQQLAQEEDEEVRSKKVWESFLEPKTTKVGGSHRYFVIRTK